MEGNEGGQVKGGADLLAPGDPALDDVRGELLDHVFLVLDIGPRWAAADDANVGTEQGLGFLAVLGLAAGGYAAAGGRVDDDRPTGLRAVGRGCSCTRGGHGISSGQVRGCAQAEGAVQAGILTVIWRGKRGVKVSTGDGSSRTGSKAHTNS